MPAIVLKREQVLQKLTNALWIGIVVGIVLLAMYVSVGRYLVNSMARFQDEILREVNARLDFVLEVDQLSGSWDSFTPQLRLSGVKVLTDANIEAPIVLDSLSVGLDVGGSLRAGEWLFYTLRGEGLELHLEVDDQGRLGLPGLTLEGGMSDNEALRFVLNTEQLVFDDVVLNVHDGDRLRRLLTSVNLRRDREFRRLRVSLLSPSQQSWFRAIAEGTGDPRDFESFLGDFHMELAVSEVGLYNDLAEAMGIQFSRGELQSELWLSVNRGQLKAAADFAASDVRFSTLSGGREFSLEQAAATVRADYSEGGWDFGAENITLVDRAARFDLAVADGSLRGGSLLIDTEDVDLASLQAYVVEEGFLPDALGEVLRSLSPAGHLSKLRLSVEDVAQRPQDWQLSANFADLSVQAWKGVPGIDNAQGYFSLDREGGVVQLNSSDFDLSFPAIYHEKLSYGEFNAELAWLVEEDRVRLVSGPFTAVADEGEVSGLFALDIPLVEDPLGQRMDLVIGLRDSHPRYRHKYLPYTLNPRLLEWLQDSFGEGDITDAGFIFRGSLRKGEREHRTVQLYFNVEDAELDYHPDWPTLEGISGAVYLDDARVDVSAARARIHDSGVSDLNVNVRPVDGSLRLFGSAQVDGDAGDALKVVNGSPLRTLTGAAFDDWRLNGALQTRLSLELDLNDPAAAPLVVVDSRWRDVDVNTAAVGLRVAAVDGELHYDSNSGFSSGSFSGELWGRPLAISVSQGRRDGQLAPLDVMLQAGVEAASVRDWLGFELLNLAQGTAAVEAHLLVPPGGRPRVEALSDLRGVSLDLPNPWNKEAAEELPMRLVMPLAGEERLLTIDLDEALFLALQIDTGGFAGGSLGFGRPVPVETPRHFVIGGRTARVRLDEWNRFVGQYLGLEEQPFAAGLLLGVRDLEVDELVAFGQTFSSVRLNAQQLPDAWKLDVSTDWMSGQVNSPADFSRVNLVLETLDVGALDGQVSGSLEGLEEDSELSLPPVNVVIDELRSGDTHWGDLSFLLEDHGDLLQFSSIRGHLRGFELGTEESGLSMDWQPGGEGRYTRLSGPLVFGDFGDVLTSYGYEQIVRTESGRLDLDLRWPGAPTEFGLASAAGTMDIAVQEGSFLKTSGAASGTLRVVSILNLTEFVRRLSLDISYIFESGVPFDSIEGQVLFRSGQLEFPQIDVLGRSSRFQFVGLADVEQERIDGELVATLPVASNLPWVAALISGLPAAAGVYVVSKLFTKQMDRFSSAVYSLSGPWDDPAVEFERIFDDTAEQQRVVADEAEQEDPTGGLDDQGEGVSPDSAELSGG
jgi:uncharacterized protein (TIGR02099 family)